MKCLRAFVACLLVTSGCGDMGPNMHGQPDDDAAAGGTTMHNGGHAGGMMGGTGRAAVDAGAIAPYAGAFDGVLAEDRNPVEGIVEVELEARPAHVEIGPGRSLEMWTYNGALPGPRIEARVGDTIRVHFTNSLPEPTTIHWHGLRVPAEMDGVLAMQEPVQPGGTFRYEFALQDAGTFWYHPHIRSDEQVERGLYGAIVVRGPDEPMTTTERVVVLDDVLLDTSGQLAPPSEMDAMMGREGNVILVNGHVLPGADLAIPGLHRFRFINAANARYFQLSLPASELVLIGRDGSLFEKPQRVDRVSLVPGQRADVLVRAEGPPGETAMVQSLPYDRGHAMMMPGSAPSDTVALFSLRYTTGASGPPPSIPESFAPIAALPEPTLVRELKLEESMGMMGSAAHGGHAGAGAPMEGMMTFSINGEVYPNVTPLRAKLGAVEAWNIVNTTEMDHPFHLHGFRFQVVAIEGQPPPLRAWEDTINVKAKQTTTLRVALDERPGTWMFHCHILEHAERGMAGELVLSP